MVNPAGHRKGVGFYPEEMGVQRDSQQGGKIEVLEPLWLHGRMARAGRPLRRTSQTSTCLNLREYPEIITKEV